MPEVIATTNRKPAIEMMSSPWPDKLRELKLNESLYISLADLSIKQATIMVRNFEQRINRRANAKIILFSVLSDKDGTLITCIKRTRASEIARRPPGFTKESARALAKKGREKTAPIRAEATLRAAGSFSDVERLADGVEPCAIIEAAYPDGTHRLVFVKDAEQHGHLLNKFMKEGMAVSVQTFAAGKIMKRKVSWEG